ncbi:MAG: 50S ribosomal protein L10 [Patescibacteria group bacterium]
MAKTRQQKEETVAELTDLFKRMKSAVFTQVNGYTMEDANNLRSLSKAADMKVFVAKKTLLNLAAKEANVEGLAPRDLEGSILTMVGMSDEVAPAKTMAKFLKDREKMSLVGGVLEGKFIDATMVKSLAKLPSKQELLGKLVGTLNAPVSGFVNVLAGNLRGLVTVLNAVKDKKTA